MTFYCVRSWGWAAGVALLAAGDVAAVPELGKAQVCESKALRLSTVLAVDGKSLEPESAHLEVDRKDDDRFVANGSLTKWAEASIFRSVRLVTVPDGLKGEFSKWFGGIDWGQQGKDGSLGKFAPVGLSPKRVMVIPDDRDSALFWKIDLYERSAGTISLAMECMEGIFQGRPDTRIAALPGGIAEELWDCFEKGVKPE